MGSAMVSDAWGGYARIYPDWVEQIRRTAASPGAAPRPMQLLRAFKIRMSMIGK
jgi:hypothetical protein